MGGSKNSASNRQMREANATRQLQIDEENLSNEGVMRTMMYNSGREGSIAAAQNKAVGAVNDEMLATMTKAQDTITNYEGQERRRLFEAKKGSGQVEASDMAITEDMYNSAKKLLKNGSAGWDSKRDSAMDVGGGGWDGANGSLEEFIGRGQFATASQNKQMLGTTSQNMNSQSKQLSWDDFRGGR